MGALTASSNTYNTINHPKRHLSYTNTSPLSPSPDLPVSKRPRLSSPPPQILSKTPTVLNPTVSRLSRYPESLQKPRREVHAPVRVNKFGLSRDRERNYSSPGSNPNDSGGMGNLVSKKYEIVRDIALGTCRYIYKGKEKEVIGGDIESLKLESVRKGVGGYCRYSGREKGKEVINVENEGLKGLLVSHDAVDSSVEEVVEDDEVRVVEERSVVTVSNGNGLGVENLEKALDSLDVNDDIRDGDNVESVEAYKKLLETVERKNRKFETLNFQIQLAQKKLSAIQALRALTKPKEDVVEEIPHEPFIPITEEELAEVKLAFSAKNRRKILVTHENSNIDITAELLQCLTPRQWLNDEVINVYLELLKEREKREPQKFLKCHFFSTFFYKKLTSGGKDIYDYKAVRRWTSERKLGYFLVDCDKIFVPIHREIHWCLAIINKKDQKFQYLDSLKGQDYRVLQHVARYYVEEVKDKTKKDIDVSNWEHEFVEDLPEQENGYDCGVFMVKYADFYSRGLKLCFGQEHMPYFRTRIAKEILRLRAD